MFQKLVRLALCVLSVGGMMFSCSSGSDEDGVLAAGSLSLTIGFDDCVAIAGGGGNFATGYMPAEGAVSITLSEEKGGASHTWTDSREFPQGQLYLPGRYFIEALSGNVWNEGFDSPTFSAVSEVEMLSGVATDAEVKLTLANSLVRIVYDIADDAGLSSVTASVQSAAGSIIDYPAGHEGLLCLQPGGVQVYVTAETDKGDRITWPAYKYTETERATLYGFQIVATGSADGPVITVDGCNGMQKCVLTEEFLNAAAPTLKPTWDAGEVVRLSEGADPDKRLSVKIESQGRLRSVMLSTHSKSLIAEGMATHVDLMAVDGPEQVALDRLGLKWNITAEGGDVDFSDLLSSLVFLEPATALSTFTLIAVDEFGRCSEPVELRVETLPVDITVTEIAPAIMGVDRAVIRVECAESGFERHVEVELCTDEYNQVWVKDEDVEITQISSGKYELSVKVSEGSKPVAARILYCREVRAVFEIPRTMPAFSIEVDPYATMAAVKIVPEDKSMLETITRRVYVYINGEEAPLYLDLASDGIVTVIGLTPSSVYEFKATMMHGVETPEFTAPVRVVTEATPQLPNCDFEDREEGIKYDNLPSGGRYSQTVVPIHNWQHSVSYDLEVPKGWANTNAKTFATGASEHNSWYMQPSVYLTRNPVMSQSFAAVLTSVAYDPHGPAIEDYTQTGTPYLDYSPIVPRIAYKAAGKLFLGAYAFNPATASESYVEGVEWGARPRSLNGYYMYAPCDADRSDYGMACIEVLGTDSNGNEVVIADGEAQLTLAAGYTAFSVPLRYRYFGVKASRLKVMFASSRHVGSIAEETRQIVTVPDPQTASSTGSCLWLDNVTLAY